MDCTLPLLGLISSRRHSISSRNSSCHIVHRSGVWEVRTSPENNTGRNTGQVKYLEHSPPQQAPLRPPLQAPLLRPPLSPQVQKDLSLWTGSQSLQQKLMNIIAFGTGSGFCALWLNLNSHLGVPGVQKVRRMMFSCC